MEAKSAGSSKPPYASAPPQAAGRCLIVLHRQPGLSGDLMMAVCGVMRRWDKGAVWCKRTGGVHGAQCSAVQCGQSSIKPSDPNCSLSHHNSDNSIIPSIL